MKNRFFTSLAALLVTLLCIPEIQAQVAKNQNDQTTLHITIAVGRQEIVAGPYARYAQKYLGTAAPLSDKVLHEVTSVNIAEINNIQTPAVATATTTTPTHMSPEKGFPRLTVDKTSAATVSLEESARLAAEKIFEIRKSRLDLITGELGENVFGGGLSAALDELSRLEEEYLSLFLGRQTTSSDVRQYRITPTKTRPTYTVCRFSETDGLLPQDDMSGMPVVLELKPTSGTFTTEVIVPQSKPNPRAIPQLIPADILCRIIFDGVELTSEIFSIPQMGETIYVMP